MAFDGTIEEGTAPMPLTGSQVHKVVKGIKNVTFGKKSEEYSTRPVEKEIYILGFRILAIFWEKEIYIAWMRCTSLKTYVKV
jgi:hypothetical protein